MKEWLIVIGIDKFYLTEKEKDYYLDAITSGVKFVDLGDKVLGANFQYMAKDTAIEEGKMIDDGRWQCNKGKWHRKGWDCSCGLMKKEITKEYLLDEKTKKYSLQEKVNEVPQDEDGL